jgi:membrane-associated phospholipid phosphatase
MPSGDSAQCALWVGMVFLFFNIRYPLMLIPFVMFGRVYYFCHWVTDTIVGVLIGFIFAYIGYT